MGPNPSPTPTGRDFGLSNLQAKSLAGKSWSVGAVRYQFQRYDPKQPGQPPWKSGAEGKAFPLLGVDGKIAAYLKFYNRTSQFRFDRSLWLMSRQLHAWDRSLIAAPRDWADTVTYGRPVGTEFDFGGSLCQAVPGLTWLEAKIAIAEGRLKLDADFRRRCVLDLVRALAVLEAEGVIHGDLSPNNLIIDPTASEGDTAAYLIDFDAFVVPGAQGAVAGLSLGDGGSYGTEGYAPPDLFTRVEQGDDDALIVPYSDRHGRDMLMIELLGFRPDHSPEQPPTHWGKGWTPKDPNQAAMLAWLVGDPRRPLPLSEEERPTSEDLAKQMGCATVDHPRPAPIHLKRDFLRAPVVVPPSLAVEDPLGALQAGVAWANIPANAPGFARPVAAVPPGLFQPIPAHVPHHRNPRPRSRVPRWLKRLVISVAVLMGLGLLGAAVYARFSWWSWLDVKVLDAGAGTINALAISEEGRVGVSTTLDGSVSVWNLESGTRSDSRPLAGGAWATCVAISQDGFTVVSGHSNGLLRVWDRANPEKTFDIPAYANEGISALAISADAKVALTLNERGQTLRRWDLEDAVITHEHVEIGAKIKAIRLSRRGDRGVMAGYALLSVWDFGKDPAPVAVPGSHDDYVELAIDPTGREAVVNAALFPGVRQKSSGPQELPSRSIRRIQLVDPWKSEALPVTSNSTQLRMAASEGLLYMIVRDSGVQVIRVDTNRVLETLPPGDSGTGHPVAISGNGKRVMYSDGGLVYSTWVSHW